MRGLSPALLQPDPLIHHGEEGRESCQTPQSKIKATNKVSSRKLPSAETTGAAATATPPLGLCSSCSAPNAPSQGGEAAVLARNLPESQPSPSIHPCRHHLARGQKTQATPLHQLAGPFPNPFASWDSLSTCLFLNLAVRISAICPGRPFLCFGKLFGWRIRIS